MSDRPTSYPQPQSSPPNESDAIARLLRLADPSPAVPRQAEDRVKAATRRTWRESTRARRRRYYVWGAVGLAAASLAIAVITMPRTSSEPASAPSRVVATLRAATGTVTRSLEAEARPLRLGESVSSGTVLETGAGVRAALELPGGASLRLDSGTSLILLAARVVRLERGALYFDSAGDASIEVLEVHTDLGVVRDIGTQFEVRRDGELRVRVREGLVNLDRDGATYEASAGVELRLSERGELSRHATPVFGPNWDWILDVAPAFTLEGHTLDAFLAWVSRETGWQTEFVERTVGDSAPDVVLHGSIEGLRPDRALDAVLPTCGLAHRFEGGVLLIEAETR